MIKPTLLHAGWMSACLALSLLTAPVLAEGNAIDPDEEAARHVYVPRAGSVVRTVGPGAACDFSDLQSALSVAGDDDTVRVMSGTYTGSFTIASKALTVIGGFPDCTSSSPTGKSTLDGQGSGLVLDIYYPAADTGPVRQVNIENMNIRNGGGSGFSSGGAVVEGRPGRLSVNFRNVEISNNNRTGTGDDGGGLRVLSTGDAIGFGTFVTLDNDSIVASNTTAGDGGGVHCASSFDDGTLTMLRMGTTPVFSNEAANGGGLAVSGCRNVYLYNGGPIFLFIPTGGFVNNTATATGGGIYVENGGEAILRATSTGGFGDADEAALIANNTATSGGAARVTGVDSNLTIQDAYVSNNSADAFGGAFRIDGAGTLNITRRDVPGACQPPQSGGGILSRPPCSVIENNDGNSGGAFSMNGASNADVSRTIIRNNTSGAGGGPVARLRNTSLYTGANSVLRIEGSVIHGNSGGFILSAVSNSVIRIQYSTITDNPAGLTSIAAADGQEARLQLFNSIVQSGTWSSISGDGTTSLQLDCVIGNVSQAATGATSVNFYSEVDPQFVDAAGNNYRLRPRSPAIDYCDGFVQPEFRDLDGNVRGQDWTGPTPDPAPGPADGNYDLGAFETPFEVQNVDLAVASAAPTKFVSGGDSFTLELELTNQGANTAFADISVIDEFTAGAVVNQQWTCTAPAGVTCSPASGSGDMSTTISDLDPGQSVTFEVTADPANPGLDTSFDYVMIATESGFNSDTNASNNEEVIEIRTGVFADGFE